MADGADGQNGRHVQLCVVLAQRLDPGLARTLHQKVEVKLATAT